MKGGNGMAEGIVALVVIVVILIIMPKGAEPLSPSSNTYNTPNNSNYFVPSSTGGSNTPASSAQARNIVLGTGNGARSYQPYEEYITIENRGKGSVDITGWRLENGKSERAYDVGGTERYFPSDRAIIGQASRFISPIGANVFQNIVLQPRDKAIVTTGLLGPQLPYKIVSFKENICSGYLENLPEYKFTPALTRSCPDPEDEPGVIYLDTECRQFVERMRSCYTPEFNTRDKDGNICRNCVDDTPLPSSCVAFVKSHFNYSDCIANHQNDPDFSSRTWRIFLGQRWEMWAERYETIKLFDNLGQSVVERTY